MDGVLGIGRGTSADSLVVPQVMDVLASSNLIGSKLYGIHLSRNKDGLLDGELDLGAVNKERFSGDLNWLDAVDGEAGFWEVAIADAGVDGKTLGLSGRTAIIDTGTSFILVPKDDAAALHKQVEGLMQDGETFSVPCDTAAVVQFSFNQHVYNISTADWIGDKLASGLCRSNIIGRQTFSETQWLVGDVFLKNVYSVFDFDQKRVGFGVRGAETVSADASSSTSGESSSTLASGATSGFSRSAQTGNSAASGTANPTADAGSTPQGQKDHSGAASSRASASLLGLAVAAMVFSVCI